MAFRIPDNELLSGASLALFAPPDLGPPCFLGLGDFSFSSGRHGEFLHLLSLCFGPSWPLTGSDQVICPPKAAPFAPEPMLHSP